MNHNEGTFLQVLCKWQHIYCQYPRACHPLKAIEPTSLYWDILTAYLKMPGDHAVIFRKDVPIQGFPVQWAHTCNGPGVRTCLLWVCYLHLTKLEFDTEEPILVGSELGNSNIKWFISLLSLPNNLIPHPTPTYFANKRKCFKDWGKKFHPIKLIFTLGCL